MAAFIINLFFLVAQPSENAPPPPNYPPPPPGQQVPIDENIWILLALGILLGIYILYKRRRAINKAA